MLHVTDFEESLVPHQSCSSVSVPLNSGLFLGSSSVPVPYSTIPVPAIEPVMLQPWLAKVVFSEMPSCRFLKIQI